MQEQIDWVRAEVRSAAAFTSLAAGRVLLWPIGSFEQHGPHLPIGTDAIITDALVAKLAAARRDRCLVLPMLPFSASDEHAGLPGTLSIGNELLGSLLARVRESLGSVRLLVVTAHGGNTGLLARLGVPAWVPHPAALRDFAKRHAMPLDARGLWHPDAHAGRTETSIMLALRPELVGPFEDVVGYTGSLAPVARLLSTKGVHAVASNGVLGDPAGANAPEGFALIDALTEDLTHTFDIYERGGPHG